MTHDPPGHDALDIDDVRAASARLAGHVRRTPVLTVGSIDRVAGASVLCKAEHLQRSGSFKARGAHNALLLLTDEQRERGVVAVSSGNHAAAVACAAGRLGVRADVYVPHDAPEMKVRAATAYGAAVHRFDRHGTDRVALGQGHADRTGATLIEPFDAPDVMAGQGTVAVELHDDYELDVLVVPMSGGGLMAGCAVATAAVAPRCRLVGVEPTGADDTRRSLETGVRVAIDQPATIADGLAIATPGARTFEVNRQLVDEVVTVTDQQIVQAMVLLFERAKQVVEPSGAAALAAVVAGAVDGQRIGVVLSGGNIEVPRFASLVAGHAH